MIFNLVNNYITGKVISNYPYDKENNTSRDNPQIGKNDSIKTIRRLEDIPYDVALILGDTIGADQNMAGKNDNVDETFSEGSGLNERDNGSYPYYPNTYFPP